MERWKIAGSASDVRAVHRTVLGASDQDVLVSPIRLEPADPIRPLPLGMQPHEYFVIVFAAHLGSVLAHDAIKALCQRAKVDPSNVSVRQDGGSSQGQPKDIGESRS